MLLWRPSWGPGWGWHGQGGSACLVQLAFFSLLGSACLVQLARFSLLGSESIKWVWERCSALSGLDIVAIASALITPLTLEPPIGSHFIRTHETLCFLTVSDWSYIIEIAECGNCQIGDTFDGQRSPHTHRCRPNWSAIRGAVPGPTVLFVLQAF